MTGPTGPTTVATQDVVIDGAPSIQIRQGANAVLPLTGLRLDRLFSVSVGTLVIDDPTHAHIVFNVLHGAPIGASDVTLTDDVGNDLVLPGALVVTAITASPAGHAGAAGTVADPLGSMTDALYVAGAGDTVQLTSGVFPAANEDYPLAATAVTGADSAPSVPEGVTLRGAGRDATRVVGPGAASTAVAVAIAGATVRDLTFAGFRHGILATGGVNTLAAVGVTGSTLGAGLIARHGATVVADDVRITGNMYGVLVRENSNLTLRGSEVAYNQGQYDPANGSVGVWATGAASVSVIDCDVHHNQHDGLRNNSSGVFAASGTQVHDNANTGNPGEGQLVSTAGTLRLTNTVIDAGGQFGLICDGNSELRGVTIDHSRAVALLLRGTGVSHSVRDSTFLQQPFGNALLAIDGDPSIELGNGINGGNNVFFFDSRGRVSNGPYAMISDQRASCGVGEVAYSGMSITLYIRGVTAPTNLENVWLVPGASYNSDRIACTNCTPGDTAFALDVQDSSCAHHFYP